MDLERLVAFGHALARALDHPRLPPPFGSTCRAWRAPSRSGCCSTRDTKWECLIGDTRGAEEAWSSVRHFAERLLAGWHVAPTPEQTGGISARRRRHGGRCARRQRRDELIDPDRHRAIEAAAALLAVSLKNAQLFTEVRENSWRDALTGCVTRAYATEVMDGELRRARRSKNPISLILFDLDHFKGINDRYGHLCGDAVLAAVGQRMRDVLRGSDLKCRYGGEEFLVLLPETPLQGACRVAETLRHEIADRADPVGARDWSTITASFGVTQALPAKSTSHAIVGRADAALYRAKERAATRVRAATETVVVVEPQEHVG